MKNTYKRILKASALSVVAAAMTAAVLPVNAETANTDVTKTEDVYVVLNSDGTVSKTTVSDTLHSDTGFSDYDDVSNLKDAQNLKSTDPLTTYSDGYLWNSSEKDIYYQGTYDGSLPLSVSISYTLDGTPVSEEELLGKSGHVAITISLTNNKYQYYRVNGNIYKISMPIAAVAGAVMDKDIFSNVTVNTGTVSSDSSHEIVAAVSLPGMKESLNGILTASSIDSFDKYLYDETVIEADAENYEAPEIMLAASTDTDELKTELGGTDLSSVWSDIDQLQAATSELMEGTQALYDGTVQLTDGSSQLSTGAESMSDGTSSLSIGAEQISEGADQLAAGLGQLSSKSSQLNTGAAQIEATLFTEASTALNTKTGGSYTLTAENYTEILEQLLGITPSDRTSAFTSIASQIRSTSAGASLTDDQIKGLIYMAAKNSTSQGLSADIQTQAANLALAGKVNAYASAVKTAMTAGQQPYAIVTADQKANMYLLGVSQKIGYAGNTAAAYKYLYSQVSPTGALAESDFAVLMLYAANNEDLTSADIFTPASKDIAAAKTVAQELSDAAQPAGTALINGTLDAVTASYAQSRQDLKDSLTELNSLVAFVEGLKTYTDGVDSAYEGAQTLASGASKLADGASDLNTGASKLKSGIDELSEGISSLQDGAKALMNGMTQYNDEGISKLTDSTQVSDLKNADDLLKQMKQSGEEYNNYSGISDGTSGSVKFIYKVKTVKTEKSTVSTSTSDVTKTNDGLSVWQRIVNLFVFWK